MTKFFFEDIKINNKKAFSEEKPVISTFKLHNKEEISDKKIYLNINNNIDRKIEYKQRLQRTPQLKTNKVIINKPLFVVFVIVIFLTGLYLIGNLFHKADVTLSPKQQVLSYNNKNFFASKNTESNDIEFEIMIISDKKKKNITLTEPQNVSIKSKGSILLYNELSSTPQKILKGTFLSDEEGKTYQTDSEITIPGYKIDQNKKIIPGTASANISSFLPGESYNGSPSNFYINSFKGTNKYNLVYGKLKEEITGGASGLYYVLQDVDKNKIENIAQTSLKDDLFNQAKILFPPGYVLYPNAMTFSYTNSGNLVSKTPEAQIEIEGFLTVVLLDRKSLSDYIIKTSLPNISEEELADVKIFNLENLSFDFVNNEQVISKDINSISFKLTGDINLLWEPKLEKIKTKLLNIHKNEVLSILRQEKGIDSAIIKVFPPWKKYLPDDLSKINVLIKKDI